MVKCKICNVEFETDKSFHGHLKSHKLRMVEYYQAHEPRYDLLTGELINFKNKDYYFSNDFNNKLNNNPASSLFKISLKFFNLSLLVILE